MIASRVHASALVLICIAGSACGDATAGAGAPIRVVIPAGASFAEAVDSLERVGLVTSPRLFSFYAARTGRDRELRPGTYRIPRGSNWPYIMQALTEGRGIVRTVTIPEGFSLQQIVPLLSRTLGVSADSVEAAVRDTALRRELDVPAPTLEGYLFPDTYTFGDGTTARSAVRMMTKRFREKWQDEWDERLETLALSRHNVLTLASIVEKEARLDEERPVIAAVYHNRLKKRMLLQADPTVQYARGSHTGRVLYRDLEIESRYNTYKYPGLPPGPIASPGVASIQAALFPAGVSYLYFVAHPDGHHEFRNTFAEHSRAAAEIRREVRSRASKPAASAPRK